MSSHHFANVFVGLGGLVSHPVGFSTIELNVVHLIEQPITTMIGVRDPLIQEIAMLTRFLLYHALLLAILSLCSPAYAEDDRRPNILFAIADDWSQEHAGAYGC